MGTIALILAILAAAVAVYTATRQQQINSQLAERINALIATVERLQAAAQQPAEPVAEPAPAVTTPATPVVPAGGEQSQVLYLSRADEHGRFTRVSPSLLPGNSIYRLTATGDRGTFEVIDDRAVHAFAMMMPTLNLTTACEGSNIQVSDGYSAIATVTPGTANRDGDTWRVTTPATIRYTR